MNTYELSLINKEGCVFASCGTEATDENEALNNRLEWITGRGERYVLKLNWNKNNTSFTETYLVSGAIIEFDYAEDDSEYCE